MKDVCDALTIELKNEVITCPVDRGAWEEIAEDFYVRWNVPHACGALDGKHIAIKKPSGTGTMYHNYKGFFSIVMMALVDADYKFMWIDVGGLGSQSGAQIYNQSKLKESLEDGSIGLPPPAPLPNDVQDFAYFLFGRWRLWPPNIPHETILRPQVDKRRNDCELQDFESQSCGRKRIWYYDPEMENPLVNNATDASDGANHYWSLCVPL